MYLILHVAVCPAAEKGLFIGGPRVQPGENAGAGAVRDPQSSDEGAEGRTVVALAQHPLIEVSVVSQR